MRLLQDFKKFALRGNVVDMAVGFTVGAAFTTVVKSLVSDIIMPPIASMTGGVEFTEKFIVLEAGDNGKTSFATSQAAREAGAITLEYGQFINNVIALLLVALAMFIIIRVINHIDAELDEHFGEEKPKGEPENKKCSFCRMAIAYRATRCPHCTSHLTTE